MHKFTKTGEEKAKKMVNDCVLHIISCVKMRIGRCYIWLPASGGSITARGDNFFICKEIVCKNVEKMPIIRRQRNQ